MKLSRLSPEAQAGLVRWATHHFQDDLLWDGIGSSPEHWAWLWFQLRVSEDNPEWFPKGKWATLQHIQTLLEEEARAIITDLSLRASGVGNGNEKQRYV